CRCRRLNPIRKRSRPQINSGFLSRFGEGMTRAVSGGGRPRRENRTFNSRVSQVGDLSPHPHVSLPGEFGNDVAQFHLRLSSLDRRPNHAVRLLDKVYLARSRHPTERGNVLSNTVNVQSAMLGPNRAYPEEASSVT